MIHMFDGKPFNGFNFAPFCGTGILSSEEAYDSLKVMAETTAANFVIFTPAALQEETNSTEVRFNTARTCGDDELRGIVDYAHRLGLKVGIKPTLNVRSGMWRAFVDFFDTDVPGEPTWGEWFESYSAFQLHYAKIAHELGVEMFIAGCEMVMSERRELEWRRLIADIRQVFPDGLVTYNTDKYQEHIVKWWDCVDLISTSGYYPLHSWDTVLERLKEVCVKFDKPFLFAEIGCPSCSGSSEFPNKVFASHRYAPEEQLEWYEDMFAKTAEADWICGYGIWSWHWNASSLRKNPNWSGYDVLGKPAEKVVREYYEKFR